MNMLAKIGGLTRIETVDNDEMNEQMVEDTHAVYPHALVYGSSFTLEKAIDIDSDKLLHFLQQTTSIEQWSYAYRPKTATAKHSDNSIELIDQLTQQPWHCQISVHAKAKVIDLRWHSTEGEPLLMHESIRIIDAQSALNQAGSILLWNCSHTPADNQGQHLSHMHSQTFWQQLPARRKIELNNIKLLLEHTAENLLATDSGL